MNTNYYSDDQLPTLIKQQILDFIRSIWPDGFVGENLTRDWIEKTSTHPTHFVTTTDNSLVVSYVGVVWKNLKHVGETYKTYGLSGVFTYPQFRGHHYGLDLVKQATQYITTTDADIILFPSLLNGFYEQAGYEKISSAVLLEGKQNQPLKDDDHLYMQFLSNKAKSDRHLFETQPISFGDDIW
jgi:predicted acetyltransferase